MAAGSVVALSSVANARPIIVPDDGSGQEVFDSIPPTTRAQPPTTTPPTTIAPRLVPVNPAVNPAPTGGLAAIARALTLKTKSVTVVVNAPAGLSVPNHTDISILFGTRRSTQTYNAPTGNHFVFQFPENDGRERIENVTVSLTETTPDNTVATYALLWTAPIQPLYDVGISPLTFTLLSDCDWIGESEIEVLLHTADRQRREMSFDTYPGITNVRTELQSVWHEITLDGLYVPAIYWEEDDIELPPYGFVAYPGANQPLLPQHRGTATWTSNAYGQDCSASLSYDRAIVLQSYGDL
jgi:hypothetical protein